MTQRPFNDMSPDYASDGSRLEVAEEYWRAAAARQENAPCHLTFFEKGFDSMYPGCYAVRRFFPIRSASR